MPIGPILYLPGPGPMLTEPKQYATPVVVQASTTKRLPLLGVGS